MSLTRLEPRRMLNADFALAADALQLDFTAPLAADTLTVSRDGNQYKFELDSGGFTGATGGGVSLSGPDTLLIDVPVANGLSGGVRVLDGGDLTVVLDAADFSGLAGGLNLVGVEGVTGSGGGPFDVPTLTVTTDADTPFSLQPIDVTGDFTITAAASIDDFTAGGGLVRVGGDLTLTSGALPGDYDGDLAVTADDYAVWRANFGLVSLGPPGGALPGDGNNDGVVDGADYSLWRDNVGRVSDAGSSTIEIGIGLDVAVAGATKAESVAGGAISIGAFGGGVDSGRTVELGTVSFQTSGDVQVAEDSADGLVLSTADFDGDAMADANLADDLSLTATMGSVVLDDLTVDRLTAVARGRILGNFATQGGSIQVAGDATLTAGLMATAGDAHNSADANGDGALDSTHAAIGIEFVTLGVGGLLDFDTANLATQLGEGAVVVAESLGRVRFSSDADVQVIVRGPDGVVLDRGAGALAAEAPSIRITTEADDAPIVLDSLSTDSLVANARGNITDAAGAQISSTGAAQFSSAGDIVLADTAADVLTAGDTSLFAAPGFNLSLAGDITVGLGGQANFDSLLLSGETTTVREASSILLALVVARELDLTANGAITNAVDALLTASGARLTTTTPGADITIVSGNASFDTVSLATTESAPGAADANAELVGLTGGLTLLASRVEGDLRVAKDAEGVTDAGPVTVLGDADFSTVTGDIVLDQIAVTGAITLDTDELPAGGNATVVNATAVDLAGANVRGDLSVTALIGGVSNSGAVAVTGAASFAAAAGGAVALGVGPGSAAAFGTLSLAGGVVEVEEADATELVAVAADQLTLTSAGALTDAAGAAINVTGDLTVVEAAGITLNENAADALTAGGLASFTSTGGIAIGAAGTANFGALSLAGGAAVVDEDSSTVLQTISVDSLNLTTAGLGDNSNIVIPGDLTVVSAGNIILADNPGDVLTVTGAASFTSGGDIELGLAGAARFGTLSLDTLTLGSGDASVREAGSTQLAGALVDDLTLQAERAIGDTAGAAVVAAGNAAFVATDPARGEITLADEAAASLSIDGQGSFTAPVSVRLGSLGATNLGSLLVDTGQATIQEDSSTRIDGVSADGLLLSSSGSVTDATGAAIGVTGAATVMAAGSIFLANSPVDVFSVGGDAVVASMNAVAIGAAGMANFGRLSVAGTAVEVQEDSGTELFGVTATTLELDSAGAITDSAGTIIDVTLDAAFTAAGDVTLANAAGDRLTVGGLASFGLPTNLTLGLQSLPDTAGGDANFGSLAVDAAGAAVREGSSSLLEAVAADSFALASAGAIADTAASVIDVTGDARFVAAGAVTLADAAMNVLTVGGAALFDTAGGGNIDLGVTGAGAPADATTRFGAVSFRSLDTAGGGAATGRVRIAEDDAMVVSLGDFDNNPGTLATGNVGGEVVLVADDGDGPANATAASISIEGGITADALRLQSDGAVGQSVVGVLTTPVLQVISGYDAAAFAANPDAAPARVPVFTPNVTLASALNAIDRLSVATANGSVEVTTSTALTIADTTVDGRRLSGLQVVDARTPGAATNAMLDLTLALTSTGGGITQQQVDVLAPAPEPVAIDVDAARATFTVAEGASIQLLDMEVDESAAGDTLLLNQVAVRSATANRFFIDNAAVPAARRETGLVFEAAAGAPIGIAVADQTGVELGFTATDGAFQFVAEGDLIVIAGDSPTDAFSIATDPAAPAVGARVGGRIQLHATGGPGAGRDTTVFFEEAGPLAVTQAAGQATVRTQGDLTFRGDIDTTVRDELTAVAQTGSIADEAGAVIDVVGPASLTGFSIDLADSAADIFRVTGNAFFDSPGGLNVGPAGEANFGSIEIVAGGVFLQEDSSSLIRGIMAGATTLVSAGDITDTIGASTLTASLDFTAAGEIALANNAPDVLEAVGAASFTAGGDITLGAQGRVNFRTLSLDGAAAVVEEDSTTVLDQVDVDTLTLTSAASINDAMGASIAVAGDATLTALGDGDITLGNNGPDVLTVGGLADFTALGDAITIGPAGAADFGTLSLASMTATVQEDSTTDLDTVDVTTLVLASAGDIRDVAGASIVATGDATLVADDAITLNTDAADVIAVVGLASFEAGEDTLIGPAGTANFGTLSLVGAGVTVQEDSTTDLAAVDVDTLVLVSTGDVFDEAATTILVSADADVTAGGGVVLSESASDVLVIGGSASFTALGPGGAADITLGSLGQTNFGDLSLSGDEANVQEDSTTKLDRVTLRVLTLSSTGEVSDVTNAVIDVTGLATFTATTPFEDVILGDESAVVQLGSINVVAAQHVSLQEADGFDIAGVTIAGTLFATTDAGSIEQLQGAPTIVAEAIGLRTPGGGVLLSDASAERFAAEAGGSVDIAGKSPALDALLAELADERIGEGDDAGLAPTTLSGDDLAALALDSEFGVVLLDNRGDLLVGLVADPTTGAAGDADGVRATDGHAYVATSAAGPASPFGPEPGDLAFDGDGAAGGQAVRVEGDHVFTAVAAGELVIETATTDLIATGTLGLGAGVVNDVSPYQSYDDRDGFVGGVVVIPAVPKEGVGLVVTAPSTALDAPTSRLVGTGNLDPETGDPAANTQFVELTIGRAGETNLGVQIVYADGAIDAGFQPATNPAAGPTPGDVFSHTFTEAFLNDGETNPAFPDLPTLIVVFSDPRINLYSEGGAQNLNRSITPTGAELPGGVPAPERIDQFLTATTQQIFATGEEPPPPEITALFSPPPQVIAPAPGSDFLPQTTVELRGGVPTDEKIAIEYGPLDESALLVGEAQIVEGTAESWEQGPDNYVAEIKQQIRDSDLPAGRYLIKAERSGAAEPDVTIFEKESTAADPYQGAATAVASGAPLAEAPAEAPAESDAWTAAWIDWAQSDRGGATDAGPAFKDAPAAPAWLRGAPLEQELERASVKKVVDRVDALMVGGVLLSRQGGGDADGAGLEQAVAEATVAPDDWGDAGASALPRRPR